MWSLWNYEQLKNQFYWCLGEGWRAKRKQFETHLRNTYNWFLIIFILSCPSQQSHHLSATCFSLTTVVDNEFDLTLAALVMVSLLRFVRFVGLWGAITCVQPVVGGSSAQGTCWRPSRAGPYSWTGWGMCSKPGWSSLAVWLIHKIMLLHFGGLQIMVFNTTFHIYSYWMAPVKTSFIPNRLGNETPRCRAADLSDMPTPSKHR